MQEGLLKESDEHGVAPRRRHALQGLIGRLPANLRSPFRPIRVEACKMLIVGNLFAFDRIHVIRPRYAQPFDFSVPYLLVGRNALAGVSAA
jgi:hypothetical protein